MIPAFLTKYAAKFGVYLALALVLMSVGFYGGYRFELSGVLKAQLALASQQKADATEAAAMNAKLAADMVAQDAVNNNAVAAHQGRGQAAQAAVVRATAANDAMAAKPGDDGPVAPDLRRVLDDYASSHGEAK